MRNVYYVSTYRNHYQWSCTAKCVYLDTYLCFFGENLQNYSLREENPFDTVIDILVNSISAEDLAGRFTSRIRHSLGSFSLVPSLWLSINFATFDMFYESRH